MPKSSSSRPTRPSRLPALRYLGLELAGAKNSKTTLAALEYYPSENKIFLLEIYEEIGGNENQTGDEALLTLFEKLGKNRETTLGINVSMDLPPCIPCTRKSCPLPDRCTVPAVKWMREVSSTKSQKKQKAFTPYTQTPSEIWLRSVVLPRLSPKVSLEIDETLGGTKAPLTARMVFLKRHLAPLRVLCTHPKLSVVLLAEQLKIDPRIVGRYRKLDEGAQIREELLETISKGNGIFIYEKDLKMLSRNLSAFDAFICAYTALLADTGRCDPIAKGFPKDHAWIYYPKISPKPQKTALL